MYECLECVCVEQWQRERILAHWYAQPKDYEWVCLPYLCSYCLRSISQISSPNPLPQCHTQTRKLQTQPLPEKLQNELAQIRLPRAVQATYLAPLKREATHNIPVCDLQLRSYSVRNLEVFTDFALRAAYFLNLPAAGPVPLPKIIERWTVPRASFIFKKSQENFERKTMRRLIQIKDGHPETVSIWLAFLRKYQYFGVGMKANVYDHSGLNVTEDMDQAAKEVEEKLGEKMELFGRLATLSKKGKDLDQILHEQPFKAQWGADAPMGGNQSVPSADKRIELHEVTVEGR